jgi:hypothetical protein
MAFVSQQGKMTLSTPAAENLSVLLFPISDLHKKKILSQGRRVWLHVTVGTRNLIHRVSKNKFFYAYYYQIQPTNPRAMGPEVSAPLTQKLNRFSYRRSVESNPNDHCFL